MNLHKDAERLESRIRAHAKLSTEDTRVNDERIEQNQQDANLTTADLARSARDAGTEERRKEIRRENPTPNPRNVATETGDVARTNPNAAQRPPVGTTATATAAAPAREGEDARLFSETDARGFRARWEGLQVSFVDEPRRSVEQADSLVAEAIKRLAEVFAEERQKLEGQWDRGDNVSTEDLRLALQRYRAFFGRLLSV
jgi:hypothetical protein